MWSRMIIPHGMMARTKSITPEYAVSSVSPLPERGPGAPRTAGKDVVRDDHVGAPAGPSDERMPRLFQRRASHPEQHRSDPQEQVHGNQGEPNEDPRLAMDAVGYHQQRDAKRGLAPRRGANRQGQ